LTNFLEPVFAFFLFTYLPLLTEVNSLNEKWAQTVKLAQEQNKRLIMALKSSESMYNRIKELTEWLEPIKDDISLFYLLARKPNLEKNYIYSNKFFHNFHLSESSFICPGLRTSDLA
jgi:hypothetical protein